MAPKNLNAEEMHQISAGWVDPQKKAHQTILSIDMLKAQLPLLNQAHKGITDVLRPVEDPRVAAIIAIEVEKDLRHDDVIRGSYGVLTHMAELLGGDEGQALLQLRDVLIPDGLPSMQKTYRAEATQAKELQKALTPGVRQRTDSIRIGEGSKTLTAFLEEWIQLGLELGDLEDEKGELLAGQTVSVSAAAILKARNYWVRVANAFVANADLAGLTDEQRAAIFGPLMDAEGKADARARQKKAKPVEKPTEGEPSDNANA